ncbi:hypothetical protein [Piscirickettsia litoralis]|uniref:Uncharacterized protein n=1 Tax=Piscirickettsia litoralis TaxID=1891921 RepID=A0ABX3A648_9GAMM|nr:hypothetical protein [Piscirickettsia litoralis]ODN42950.1 hypothetical protein BGC07_08480 [Piscirickettsia litoralis]
MQQQCLQASIAMGGNNNPKADEHELTQQSYSPCLSYYREAIALKDEEQQRQQQNTMASLAKRR